ncbi:response regulator [Paeniglutamicibacter sp. NPDC012692]|uniref:response regulator transcription factor n=1 Tax=Paeniglutamicibacter sp. NPDC012692 TaxID=3364388 RepID=UPI0036BEB4CE
METLTRIRVHLADGDPFLRIGLEITLGACPEIELESVTTNGTAAIEAARTLRPDIVLMESTIENVSSMIATRHIRSVTPGTKVVMFSAVHDVETMKHAHIAGVTSFLSKHSIAADLGTVLRLISSGNSIFAKPSDAEQFLVPLAHKDETRCQLLRNISQRDRQLLIELAQGRTNRQIAVSLHVSEATIKAGIGKLIVALAIQSRVQLAVLAVQAGLLEKGAPTVPLSTGYFRHSLHRA